MNLLTIAAIGAGLYLLMQPKKQSSTTLCWSNKSKDYGDVYTKLPKNIFHPIKSIKNKIYVYSLEINNENKLSKTDYYPEIQEWTLGPFIITEGWGVNQRFIKLLGIYNCEESKAFKYLYDKDYKFMNTIYHEYLKEFINKRIKSNQDEEKINKMLPDIFTEYFNLLKKAGIPESKWPSNNLGI